MRETETISHNEYAFGDCRDSIEDGAPVVVVSAIFGGGLRQMTSTWVSVGVVKRGDVLKLMNARCVVGFVSEDDEAMRVQGVSRLQGVVLIPWAKVTAVELDAKVVIDRNTGTEGMDA